MRAASVTSVAKTSGIPLAKRFFRGIEADPRHRDIRAGPHDLPRAPRAPAVYAGDVVPGTLDGLAPQWLTAAWMGIAVLMLVPIVMIVASVIVTGGSSAGPPSSRPTACFLLDLAGLPAYPGLYDELLSVSLVLNGATAWYTSRLAGIGGAT